MSKVNIINQFNLYYKEICTICDTMALCCLHERALLPPPHLPPFSKLSCYMYITCIYYEQLEYITNSQKKEKLYTGIRLHAKNGKRKIYTSRK